MATATATVPTVKRYRLKRVERGGLAGSGITVKEAKASLNARIDSALAADYKPAILTYRGNTAVVWREPAGWCYTIHRDGSVASDGRHERSSVCILGPVGREQAIVAAAYHIVQNGIDVETTRTPADVPDIVADPSMRSDLLHWCRWQRAARHAQTLFPRDDPHGSQVHHWACDHQYDEQFA